MNGREKVFFIFWGLIALPCLILYLRMKHQLDVPTIQAVLTYMGVISGVYTGARGFEQWNSTPEIGGQEIDNSEEH